MPNIAGYLIVAMVLIGAAWAVDHERLETDIAAVKLDMTTMQSAIEKERADRDEKLQQIEAQHNTDVADITNQLYEAEAKHAQAEKDRDAAIAAGTQRVYVRASCPAGNGMSASSTAARGSDASAAELDPAYRQSLSELRSGAERQQTQLIALQQWVGTAIKTCNQ